MFPKLTFLAALVLVAAFVVAPHCPQAPECGHGGSCAECAPIIHGGVGVCGKAPSGGGGGGGGPTATPVATATPTTSEIWKAIVGEYSFEAAAIYCDSRDPAAYQIDPITVVGRFHYHSSHLTGGLPTPEEAWEKGENHLVHHGWFETRDTGQYFRDGTGCALGEISRADPVCEICGPVTEQWHARGHQNIARDDPFHPRNPGEIFGATITAYTPHYDELTVDSRCQLVVGHYVEEDYDPDPTRVVSGFDRGREDLLDVMWFPGGHHQFIESQ